MKNKTKYEMIIFDVDGTLCNAVDIMYNAVNRVLKENNIDRVVSKETILTGQGLSTSNFAKHCMPFLEQEQRERYVIIADNLKNEYIKKDGVNIYDDVKETIAELSKKYKLAIVSNCGENYIETVMEKLEIENYILDYIPASVYKITKAQAMQNVIKRNNIKKAIYVGDTIIDQKSCEEIGIDFIYAKYGFGKNLKSKYEINTFKEIIKLMENL